MRILMIEPLEPLAFSKTPVSDPSTLIGHHEVLSIPLPTTVAGLIGASIGVTIPESINDSVNALTKLVEKLESAGCSKPIVKGPLLLFRNLDIKPHVYIATSSMYIPITRLRKGFDLVYVDAVNCGECVELKHEERVGVKLVRGYTKNNVTMLEKVADMGFMYRYSVSRYRDVFGDGLTPIIIYATNCSFDLSTIERIGGEGRKAKVTITNVNRIPVDEELRKKVLETIERIASPWEVKEDELYLALTPIPILPHENTININPINPELPGLEFVKEITGVIPVVRNQQEKPQIKKRVERLSLGYSEVVKARRPQILALPQATIVKTKKLNTKPAELIETLWSIGYSSLLNITTCCKEV
ncbi:hypothetical protein QPL79_09085 [Ignisphaera sp. 4213-co]|uniref:Type I-A CRISPR-associated protein Cas5 n=1 Tax=Ignisphaera cupida TaxID=3050454 RepID=A0ABD4Z842_9CREN|nr:hypothetical protein [Ignisphaera sp. 4213-co]MDK6029516.1 hypothetical protein [Ignisphaera sp. 4213-co]